MSHRHRSRLAAFILLTAAARAGAAPVPLDPGDSRYGSLGTFAAPSGTFTIQTSAAGDPVLMSGGTVFFQGVMDNFVAVFDFDAIDLGAGTSLMLAGPYPVALLSRGGATIGGAIRSNGGSAVYPGDPATVGGDNGGAGGLGGTSSTNLIATAGGGHGGGGGGVSGNGAGAGGVFGSRGPGANGEIFLQGGSGGGGGNYSWINAAPGANGGAGGGAIEIGALGALSIGGPIEVNGGDGGFGSNAGGGGSGGMIFLHGQTVSVAGLSARGGAGGDGGHAAGTGGAGGLVAIASWTGGYTGPAPDVSGGLGGSLYQFGRTSSGTAGQFLTMTLGPPAPVPEPATWALLGTGLALLGLARRPRRAAGPRSARRAMRQLNHIA